MWNSVITQNRNVYLYDYKTERTIFIAAKHKKQMAVI